MPQERQLSAYESAPGAVRIFKYTVAKHSAYCAMLLISFFTASTSAWTGPRLPNPDIAPALLAAPRRICDFRFDLFRSRGDDLYFLFQQINVFVNRPDSRLSFLDIQRRMPPPLRR
jgi:hypothetical protein